MDFSYIKKCLSVLNDFLSDPTYENVGVNSHGSYGINIFKEDGRNFLICSIDKNIISVIAWGPYATIVKNTEKNTLCLNYRDEEVLIDLSNPKLDKVESEDILFINKRLDFFKDKEKEFLSKKNPCNF